MITEAEKGASTITPERFFRILTTIALTLAHHSDKFADVTTLLQQQTDLLRRIARKLEGAGNDHDHD
jgi:hypothetical protein